MKHLYPFLMVLPFLLGACISTEPVNTYERDELLSVRHNQQTDYTLLTYRDPLGQQRHVLRRHGVFELALTFTLAGTFELQERGHPRRPIPSVDANHVMEHINTVLRVLPETAEQVSFRGI